jgi:hypothetical protein
MMDIKNLIKNLDGQMLVLDRYIDQPFLNEYGEEIAVEQEGFKLYLRGYYNGLKYAKHIAELKVPNQDDVKVVDINAKRNQRNHSSESEA